MTEEEFLEMSKLQERWEMAAQSIENIFGIRGKAYGDMCREARALQMCANHLAALISKFAYSPKP